MPYEVQGVIAVGKGEPVRLESVTVPPGQILCTYAVRGPPGGYQARELHRWEHWLTATR
jgi:hypothetical protein